MCCSVKNNENGAAMMPSPRAEISSDSLIAVKNINVIRGGKRILHDVSISVTKHDFITIVGPNGAGKSMLLRIMAGLMEADMGRVLRAPNLRIGYIPQKLMPDVTLPISVARFMTLSKKSSADEVEKFADKLEIRPLLTQMLHNLSGGELQRVLLARALMGSPDILVLDEPAQNLDMASQLAFYKLLDEIYATTNISILMVSHDLHLVMASSKKVVCLYHHICCHGEPHVVVNDPEFIQIFGQDMARMMAVYHHEHNHEHAH
jgi:zinc transport system ATP-binding protein